MEVTESKRIRSDVDKLVLILGFWLKLIENMLENWSISRKCINELKWQTQSVSWRWRRRLDPQKKSLSSSWRTRKKSTWLVVFEKGNQELKANCWLFGRPGRNVDWDRSPVVDGNWTGLRLKPGQSQALRPSTWTWLELGHRMEDAGRPTPVLDWTIDCRELVGHHP